MTTAAVCSSLYSYSCAEGIILAIILLLVTITFSKGMRTIIKDRNTILDKTERSMYALGYIQVILLFVDQIIWSNDFLLTTIRSIRIYNDISIIQHLTSMIYEADQLIRANKYVLIGNVSIFLLWFYGSIVNNNGHFEYYCLNMDFLLLSFLQMIVNLIKLHLSWNAAIMVRQIGMERQKQEESEVQIIQIKILSIPMLGAACLQFFWDYLAYTYSNRLSTCREYYTADGFFSFIFIPMFKMATLLCQPACLFYTLYYMNLEKFNVRPTQDINAFDDARSELINFNSL